MNLPDNLKIKDLKYIGEGNQGTVYLIDPLRCIKVYKKNKFFKGELAVLQQTKGEPRFPELYEWGDNYMIREYIPGVDLETHLKDNPLTEALSSQLLDIYETFKRVRFKRLDTRLTHIIITSSGELRIIDPTNAMNKESSYPKNLLSGLEHLGHKKKFLEHVKKTNPPLFENWNGSHKKDHKRHTKHKDVDFLDKMLSQIFEN
jgi:predicted Ser/Thr protein kinase